MTFLILIISITLIGVLFVNLSPEFGGSHSEEDIARYEKSGNYHDGIFANLTETSMDMNFGGFMSTMAEFIRGVPNSKPDFALPVDKLDSLSLTDKPLSSELTWFGHSTFLLQIDGLNVLIDPMFGDVPAPHPLLGKKRYAKELPIDIEKLPKVDIIILSHDHYDHLDYGSIMKLKDKTEQFYVPLGVGVHLRAWGIAPKKINELNWWDEVQHDSLTLAFTPARHFSGRGIRDRFKTLWGSWVIKGTSDNIFFSGDGGYGDHFKEIGVKYGPFDFAMIECGQYNIRWKQIHMIPEESALAGKDLKAKVIMPIHWGAFTLALHSWTEPVERIRAKAKEIGLPLITPRIGETLQIKTPKGESDKWWIKKE